MSVTPADEREAFRHALRQLFARHADPKDLRALWSSPTGRSTELWSQLAGLGALGLLVEDQHGGAGTGEDVAVVLLEEAGRACVPGPLLESAFVAPPLMYEADSDSLGQQWLPRLADGTAIIAVSLAGQRLVADAHVADLLLVETNGGALHAVPKDEFSFEAVTSMDPSRRLFNVTAQLSSATEVRAGLEALERAHDRLLLGSAAMLIGVAEHLVSVTTQYVKEREQFGRPVGSFQAVKHLLAEAFAALALARNAVTGAAIEVTRGDPASHHGCLAARICAVGAERLANDVALQCHGGIGFTWDHDLHQWLKRGKALELAHGSEQAVAAALGAAQLGDTAI